MEPVNSQRPKFEIMGERNFWRPWEGTFQELQNQLRVERNRVGVSIFLRRKMLQMRNLQKSAAASRLKLANLDADLEESLEEMRSPTPGPGEIKRAKQVLERVPEVKARGQISPRLVLAEIRSNTRRDTLNTFSTAFQQVQVAGCQIRSHPLRGCRQSGGSLQSLVPRL